MILRFFFSACAALNFVLVSCGAWQGERPAVAYSKGGVFYLATADGRTLTSFRTDPPIGNFAISPDGATVVYTPFAREAIGGDLYLLRVSNRKTEHLSRGPYHYTSVRQPEGYSDPSFSPDGKSIVFAIHARRSGDAVETAGPFARMSVNTGEVTVLKATLNVNGYGVAAANDPHWSPDGKQILLNFEASPALVDAAGEKLQDLSARMSGGDWQHGLGWIGSSCVVYVAGTDISDASKMPAQVLNLRTGRVASLNQLMATAPETVARLVNIFWPVRVRSEGRDILVEGAKAQWRISNALPSTFVKALSGTGVGEVPEFCR